MSEKNKLIIKTNFNQIGTEFQTARKKYYDEEKKAMNLLDKNTKNEKKQLDEAYKKYNQKVDQVLKSNEYKSIENNAKNYSQEISKNLLKAKNEFIKIKEQVDKQNWNDQKKKKKLKELSDYIISKLYSKEEVEIFQKMMGKMVVVMPNISECKRLN
jgi:hypothetical protein